MSNIYQENLLDEAKNPNNYGDLENPDLISTEFNASCGDVIFVAVKLSSDRKIIEDVRWKGQGCVISQAAMSVLSKKIKNFEINKLQNLTQKEILEELDLNEISIGRVKCLMLGLNAVKKLVKK